MGKQRKVFSVWGFGVGVAIVKAWDRKDARKKARQQGLKGPIGSITLTGSDMVRWAK